MASQVHGGSSRVLAVICVKGRSREVLFIFTDIIEVRPYLTCANLKNTGPLADSIFLTISERWFLEQVEEKENNYSDGFDYGTYDHETNY